MLAGAGVSLEAELAVLDGPQCMPGPGDPHQVDLRGRSEPLQVRAVRDVASMPLS